MGFLVVRDRTTLCKMADGNGNAAQNMILAAHSLGIGSVWLGAWPQEEKIAVHTPRYWNILWGAVPLASIPGVSLNDVHPASLDLFHNAHMVKLGVPLLICGQYSDTKTRYSEARDALALI